MAASDLVAGGALLRLQTHLTRVGALREQQLLLRGLVRVQRVAEGVWKRERVRERKGLVGGLLQGVEEDVEDLVIVFGVEGCEGGGELGELGVGDPWWGGGEFDVWWGCGGVGFGEVEGCGGRGEVGEGFEAV